MVYGSSLSQQSFESFLGQNQPLCCNLLFLVFTVSFWAFSCTVFATLPLFHTHFRTTAMYMCKKWYSCNNFYSGSPQCSTWERPKSWWNDCVKPRKPNTWWHQRKLVENPRRSSQTSNFLQSFSFCTILTPKFTNSSPEVKITTLVWFPMHVPSENKLLGECCAHTRFVLPMLFSSIVLSFKTPATS